MKTKETNLTKYLKRKSLNRKVLSVRKGQAKENFVRNKISEDIGKTLKFDKPKIVNGALQECVKVVTDIDLDDKTNRNVNDLELQNDEQAIKEDVHSDLDKNGDIKEGDNINTLNGNGQKDENTESLSGGIVVDDVDLLKLSEDELDQIVHEKYNKLSGADKPDFMPFAFAYLGYLRVRATTNYIKNTKYLTVVDFTKSSGSNRFYVINLETDTVEDCIPVGHGHGKNFEVGSEANPDSFSNEDGSNKSSLGSFITSDNLQPRTDGRWEGLLMTGVEESNYRAKSRGIYIHPGPVTRSEGCFTLWKGTVKKDEEVTQEEIDENKILTRSILEKLKGGSFVFSYYDSLEYLYDSWVLNPTIGNIIHDKGIIVLYKLKTTLKNIASKAKKIIKK